MGDRTLRLRAGALGAVCTAATVVFGALAVLVGDDDDVAVDVAVLGAAKALAQPEIVALAEGPLDVIAEPAVVIAVAGACALVMAWGRWWLPIAVLLAGLALTGVIGSELKDAFGRDRPAYNVDEASNPAFPSGHARFSVFWAWLAVTIATRVRLRAPTRRALVAAGLTVTAVAGVARVYIGAHWLTDVLAGWALSAAIFSALWLLAVRLRLISATSPTLRSTNSNSQEEATMKDKLKGALIAVAAIAALGLGGTAIAGAVGGDDDATEKPITGPALERASQVAVDHVGGGQVTDTEVGDEEGYYEVEVTNDGGQVDVHLDEQFNVLATEGDNDKDEDEDGA